MKSQHQVNVRQRIDGRIVTTNILVEVELDPAAAATLLAQKAYDNKSRRAKECSGALKVTYVKTLTPGVPVR